MRELKIVSGTTPPKLTALIAGEGSSGKTTFAASAPRPLFISDASEGGYSTIWGMDPKLWWDPAVPPEVWIIENIDDINPICVKLEQAAAQGNFPWRTIVFDPISIYVDRVLHEMGQRMSANGTKSVDGRQLYGTLATHIRGLVLRLNALPAHVLWLSHVATSSDRSGLAMGGQMSEKFPAYCDFKWLTYATAVPGTQPQYELRTRPFRNWNFLGSRWGSLPEVCIPSFKFMAHYLLPREQPVSPAMPGYPYGVLFDQPAPNQQVAG